MASTSIAPGDFVFGYGSLNEFGDARPAWLRGHRRSWGVAMDNAVAIPGYKRYALADGSLPDVCVAFLDVEPVAGASVNGVLLRCDAQRLEALDRRERNYERVDVTGAIVDAPGRVWTYRGLPASRDRLRQARSSGRAVVSAGYEARVREGFARLGTLDRFLATTLPHALPVLDLLRLEADPG